MKQAILAIITSLPGGESYATQEIVKRLKKTHHVDTLLINQPTGHSFRLLRESAQNLVSMWTYFSAQHHYQCIYSTRLIPLFVASLHPQIKHVPIIFHFHGFSHAVRFSWYYLVTYFMEALSISITKHVIVPTSTSITQLKRRFPWIHTKNSMVIPNGIDHTIFHPISGKKKYILWVGRPSPEKNLPLFFDIVKKLPQYHFRLILLGSTDIPHLPNLSIKTNLTPPEIAKEYQHAMLTLITSTTEQLPLTYLESLACSTPVITSPLPSLTPLQNKIYPRLIAPSFQPNDFADVVSNYLNVPPNRQKQISKKCLQLSQQYSWEKTVHELQSIITIK